MDSRLELVYKSLVMEIRPRLQSVNVFVNFDPSSVNVTDFKIVLAEDGFEIASGPWTRTIKCADEFRIVSDSLGCVHVQDNCATFRFTTRNANPDLGSSAYEIVRANPQVNVTSDFPRPIDCETVYEIGCGNCSQVMRNGVRFERVLPLPESCDSSEWFCHGNAKVGAARLVPGSRELFYSHGFAHVNGALLAGLGVIESDPDLICKRCLAWLGSIVKTEPQTPQHKIWFHTVKFNGSVLSCALDDALETIRQVVVNPLLVSVRLMLYWRSSHVLLWVLDKSLRVHFDTAAKVYTADVSKVLFKFCEGRDGLVNSWSNDPNVTAADVSKPMLLDLLRYLYEMNGLVPKQFNASNGFYVSYLNLNPNSNNK